MFITKGTFSLNINHTVIVMLLHSYLNIESLNNKKNEHIEHHPLIPFVHTNSKVLFLGSFPPQRKRWCIDFYYPNFINDHWRIMGLLFYKNKEHFINTKAKKFCYEEIVNFAYKEGLAYYDVALAINRLKNNASDKYLEIIKPTDICQLLCKGSHIKAVVTTGEKATETFCCTFQIKTPKLGETSPFSFDNRELKLYRMPSSSRAFPMKLEKKAAFYAQMLKDLGFEKINYQF